MIQNRNMPGYLNYRPTTLYCRAYPHLNWIAMGDLCNNSDPTLRQIGDRRFCQAALRLAAPSGVSALDLWDMAAVAEGVLTPQMTLAA